MLFNILYVCFLLSGNAIAQVAPVVPGAAPETDPKNPPPPAIHYVIERRAGAFAPNWTSNLPYLAEQLKIAEARFNFTRREVKGNKIVRVPKDKNLGGGVTGKLLGEYGRDGNWYARMKIGTPPQKVQLDLDMLTRDFSVTTTSSQLGSRFEDFFSKTYAPNKLGFSPFPNCAFPADNVLLPTVNRTHGISFAHCKPRRQSLDTLLPSGALFGLAPSTSLSQMDTNLPTLIGQLVEGGFIKDEVFSLTLISGEKGILSLGGTIQEQVETVEERIESYLHTPNPNQVPVGSGEKSLQSQDVVSGQILGVAAPPPAPGRGERPGGAATHGSSVLLNAMNQDDPNQAYDDDDEYDDDQNQDQNQNQKRSLDSSSATEPLSHQLSKRNDDGSAQKVPTFEDLNPLNRAGRMKQKGQHMPSWKDGWKWSPVEGAAGWWQILLRGIWADQVKVMKNQPCIIDLNTPFILAPPLAAKAFYAAISGSYRLPPPYSNFYAYPCNNPPYLHFEFGGWRFPVMRGSKSAEHRGANGKFSLGKVSDDSGYCVGAVVETRMGVGDAAPVKRGGAGGEGAGSRFNVGFESGMLAGNGLRDVWVLGEPVFRGMGVVFDMKSKEVGFRTY